ncbi:hypothetical protein [Ruminococcus flavefaciens]|uniref:hypothetical protein n=1 Tax=Ruminococcus flavefaciens TaxID=1265 RepID=UPI0026ED3A25|nr:hypothetical protein [Ruminococcus flavefaciens]MDD7515824.1 hypothetical protein [Ruminococcus flavefaciens]MDY5691905.1 hypothetical protein [Ruminococcus flavefaciens]
MGTSYKYKCDECGFEEEYFVGGRLMTKDYKKRTEEAEEELRSAALYGKYGECVRQLVKSEREKIIVNCETDLYQCMECRHFSVQIAKEMSLNQKDFTLNIEFRHECPACHSTLLRKTRGSITFCPKCKMFTAQLVSIGKFD